MNLVRFKEKLMNNMSKLAQAFMLPVAILPMAGILLGIGGAIGANVDINNQGAQDFAAFLKGMSDVVFGNLAILFGASIAMAYTKTNQVATVFMTIIAYLVFNGVQNAFIHFDDQGNFEDIFYFHQSDKLKYMVGSNLGITSLQTSIFGGVIIGASTAWVMNRYSEIELPTALSFFSGIRLVPMIIIPIGALFGITFLIFWPWVGQLISLIGNATVSAPAGLDGLVYGMLGRSLMPFGLHHIVIGMAFQSELGGSLNLEALQNAIVSVGGAEWASAAHDSLNPTTITPEFQQVLKAFGGPDGERVVIVGDQNIWNFINGLSFNRLQSNAHGGSLPAFEWFTQFTGQYPGRFMQDYAIYQGACIGIGLAMILAADKQNRKKTGVIIGSAMAVAFLTGITEPLEFSFLFIAPLFYFGIYVPLSGLAYMLMKISGAHIGVGFARGFIDLMIYGAIPVAKGTNFWWAFIYDVAFGFVAFVTFYFMIKKFNWETPGRGNNTIQLISKKDYQKLKKPNGDSDELANLISYYGGPSNLDSVTACATRLRITVKDASLVKKDSILALGASGFIAKGVASQAIFGGKASILANQINEHVFQKETKKPTIKAVKKPKVAKAFSTSVKSPVKGNIIPLTKVNDAVFAQKMAGDGIAIIPSDHKIYAPIDGKIITVFPTKHAYGLVGKNGEEILLHLGLDTVKLEGKGFTSHVKVGQKVKANDLIAEVDLAYLAKEKYDPTVIILNTNNLKITNRSKSTKATLETKLFNITNE